MREKIPTASTSEENTEKLPVPTEREVQAVLMMYLESETAEAVELRKLEDNEGVYFWEFSVPIEGGSVLYQYIREGHYREGGSEQTTIHKIFCDTRGNPFHGFPMAKFENGSWIGLASSSESYISPETMSKIMKSRELYDRPRRECGVEIDEYKKTYFEALEKLDVDELYKIQSKEEALASETRKAVMLVCAELIKRMKTLQSETDISEEALAELKAYYKHLSQATGSINSGRVDHSR